MINKMFFLGPNGSGKSTQAKILADKLGFVYICAGDLLRREVANKTPFGLEYEPRLAKGELAPVEVTNALIIGEILSLPIGARWVVDGWPRNIPQLNFANQNVTIDKCIYFEVNNPKIIMERSLARNRGADDTEEVILHRLEIFKTQTMEVLDYYSSSGNLIKIDGELPIPEVTEKLLEIVNSKDTQHQFT